MVGAFVCFFLSWGFRVRRQRGQFAPRSFSEKGCRTKYDTDWLLCLTNMGGGTGGGGRGDRSPAIFSAFNIRLAWLQDRKYKHYANTHTIQHCKCDEHEAIYLYYVHLLGTEHSITSPYWLTIFNFVY